MLFAISLISSLATSANQPLVYVSDSVKNVVDIFDRRGKLQGQITGLSAPAGLFVDAKHNLWVANSGGGDVLMFPRGATRPSRTLEDSNSPSDVAVGTDGTVYVADSENAGGVAVYSRGKTQPSRRLVADLSGMSGIEYYVTCDAAGNVFASGYIGASPYNAVTGWLGGKQSGYYVLPIKQEVMLGIKATASGTLLLAGSSPYPSVVEYTEAGNSTGRQIGTGRNAWLGIALSPNAGVVFGADPNVSEGVARRFPSGKRFHTYKSSNLSKPQGIAYDPGKTP